MSHSGVAQNFNSQEELYSPLPEPDPDYQNDEDEVDFPPPPPPITAEELSAAVYAAYDSNVRSISELDSNHSIHSPDNPPQILPKPLQNPCVESKERQALHRELLLNYKIGKDVLRKPELNKVMRDRRETQRKKEWDDAVTTKGRTSLELKLEERAKRLKEEEDKKMRSINEEDQAPELVRMHRRITTKGGGAKDS